MRLIDADELRKSIENLPNCYNGFSDTYDKACIIGVLEELPTVEPVKHGRWKCESDMETYTIWRCSECGIGFKNTSAYCRNCGARMDAEEAEP